MIAMRWRKAKDPTNFVEQWWHDHPWLMKWARIKYEVRVLGYRAACLIGRRP